MKHIIFFTFFFNLLLHFILFKSLFIFCCCCCCCWQQLHVPSVLLLLFNKCWCASVALLHSTAMVTLRKAWTTQTQTPTQHKHAKINCSSRRIHNDLRDTSSFKNHPEFPCLYCKCPISYKCSYCDINCVNIWHRDFPHYSNTVYLCMFAHVSKNFEAIKVALWK